MAAKNGIIISVLDVKLWDNRITIGGDFYIAKTNDPDFDPDFTGSQRFYNLH